MKPYHLLLPGLATLAAHAGEPVTAPMTSAPSSSGWELMGAIYAPLMGIDGDVGIGGKKAAVEVPFKDILENLDAGLTAAFEARRGRWSVSGDFIWLKLSDIGPLSPTAEYDFQQQEILASLALGYELYGNDQTKIDFLVGGALTYMDVDLHLRDVSQSISIREGATESWIDPFVGLRVRHRFSENWGLFARVDYGGFGVASDQYWQALAGLNYRINDRASFAIAYRIISVDYQNGDFSYDVDTQGPNIGFVFKF